MKQKIYFLEKVLWLAIIVLAMVSILPNLISQYWFLDIFSNFKIQFFWIAFCLLIFSFFTLKQKKYAILALMGIMSWNAYFFAPLFFPLKKQTTESYKKLKISSINLLSSNTNTELIEGFIQKEEPEILLLMEYTPQWAARLSPVLKKYNFSKSIPRTDNFGIALFSKIEMRCESDYYKLNDKPSLVAEISVNNNDLTIVATHPVPPVSQATFDQRNLQLDNILKARHNYSENLIIIGDLNTSSFSNHFRKLTDGDLKDSRSGFGILPTWPADFTLLQTTLDHCLVSENLQVLDRTVGKSVGSDHLPISVVIGLN